jgi:hypothetical protein
MMRRRYHRARWNASMMTVAIAVRHPSAEMGKPTGPDGEAEECAHGGDTDYPRQAVALGLDPRS